LIDGRNLVIGKGAENGKETEAGFLPAESGKSQIEFFF
jgi:hypothetical protein